MLPVLHTPCFKAIVSMIIGFGFASLFRKTCKDASCMSFVSVDVKSVLPSSVYAFGSKCYTFHSSPTTCTPSKKIVKFA